MRDHCDVGRDLRVGVRRFEQERRNLKAAACHKG